MRALEPSAHAPLQGLAHDAVLESLQFALRKARAERDAEVTEADKLFNALQQHQAAAQVCAGAAGGHTLVTRDEIFAVTQ